MMNINWSRWGYNQTFYEDWNVSNRNDCLYALAPPTCYRYRSIVTPLSILKLPIQISNNFLRLKSVQKLSLAIKQFVCNMQQLATKSVWFTFRQTEDDNKRTQDSHFPSLTWRCLFKATSGWCWKQWQPDLPCTDYICHTRRKLCWKWTWKTI